MPATPPYNHFYFGFGICAICLGHCARKQRWMDTLLTSIGDKEMEISGGRQHVHLNCYRGWRSACLGDQRDRD